MAKRFMASFLGEGGNFPHPIPDETAEKKASKNAAAALAHRAPCGLAHWRKPR
jgi:hypothetical protein